jgi:hypothetical protein
MTSRAEKRTGKKSSARRRLRRQVIARSFTRFLAHRPIGYAALGPQGAAWRKGLAGWHAGWAKAFAAGSTYRNSDKVRLKFGRALRRRELAKMSATRRALRQTGVAS